MHKIKICARYVLHWDWVKAFLYWLIMSAGTVAECCFLIASLWMSLNSSIHSFIRLFLREDATVHISELATAAYVGLPECILFLASVTVINHFRTWWYNRKDRIALTWAIAYAIPTTAFLVLSLFTLGSSVLNVQFEMPGILIVIRALAGYLFGFIAFLYWSLGVPQEADRLKEKDDFIGQLITEMSKLQTQLVESETARKQLLEASKNAIEEASQEPLDYWITYTKNLKTVSIEEVIRILGVPKREVNRAIVSGTLRTSGRNKELLLVSPLNEWIKQLPSAKTEEMAALQIVNS